MSAISKIVLGTVQLGLPYGINNEQGMPTIDQSIELLSVAYRSGLRLLDTAEAYGASQEVIGLYHAQDPTRRFDVITKYSNKRNNENNIKTNVYNDLIELSVDSLEGYMFHNYADYRSNINQIPDLIGLKNDGVIKELGVSVYNNEEVEGLLEDNHIDFVQLPFNLFDNNNLRLSALKGLKLRGKKVHVRSVFLQGLFYKSLDSLTPKLKGLKKDLQKINEIAGDANASISSLALGYVLRNDLIDKVLIGVDNKQQFLDNLNHIKNSNMITDEVYNRIEEIHILDESLLNPGNW